MLKYLLNERGFTLLEIVIALAFILTTFAGLSSFSSFHLRKINALQKNEQNEKTLQYLKTELRNKLPADFNGTFQLVNPYAETMLSVRCSVVETYKSLERIQCSAALSGKEKTFEVLR